MGENRHVVPNDDGEWDIKAPGATRRSDSAKTQSDAINRARQIVTNAGGGEVIVHGKDGKIRDKDTISPAKDPFPPRDKR